jgi:hypothetical protein
MKSINLKFFPVITVAFLLLVSSCHNSDSQGNNVSAVGGKIDSTATNTKTATTSDSATAKRNTNAANSETSHSWSLIITPNTTKNHLDSVAAMWKKENIDLTISKFKCDANGNLIEIKGLVTITTGNGSAKEEFKSENLSSIQIKVDDSPNVSVKGN